MNKNAREEWIKWQKQVILEEYLESNNKEEKDISFRSRSKKRTW